MTWIFIKLQGKGSVAASLFYKESFRNIREKAFLKTFRQEIEAILFY